MKRLLSVVLASLILIAFSSCAKGEEKLSEHISQTPVELSALKLDYDPVSVCVYKNIAFALKGNSLVRYDLATGENAVIAVVGSDYQPRAIGCSGYNVAVIDDKNITVRKIIEAYYGYSTKTEELDDGRMRSIVITD